MTKEHSSATLHHHSPRWPQPSVITSLPTRREGSATPDELRHQLATTIFVYALVSAQKKFGLWLDFYDRVKLENDLRLMSETGSEIYRKLCKLKGKEPRLRSGSWIKLSDLDPTTRIYLTQLASGMLHALPPRNQADPSKGELPPAVSGTQRVWNTIKA